MDKNKQNMSIEDLANEWSEKRGLNERFAKEEAETTQINEDVSEFAPDLSAPDTRNIEESAQEWTDNRDLENRWERDAHEEQQRLSKAAFLKRHQAKEESQSSGGMGDIADGMSELKLTPDSKVGIGGQGSGGQGSGGAGSGAGMAPPSPNEVEKETAKDVFRETASVSSRDDDTPPNTPSPASAAKPKKKEMSLDERLEAIAKLDAKRAAEREAANKARAKNTKVQEEVKAPEPPKPNSWERKFTRTTNKINEKDNTPSLGD